MEEVIRDIHQLDWVRARSAFTGLVLSASNPLPGDVGVPERPRRAGRTQRRRWLPEVTGEMLWF